MRDIINVFRRNAFSFLSISLPSLFFLLSPSLHHLPSLLSRLLDAFCTEAPPTSIALSPSGDFLCSTHVDDLAIYLWSNRTLYSHISLRPLPANHTPSFIELPHTMLSGEEEMKQKEKDELEDEREGVVPRDLSWKKAEGSDGHTTLHGDDITREFPPLAEGLVTLSCLPKSRWHNLQQLDVIKQHNKPKEPPTKPKQAPFFLPTTPGLQPKFTSAGDDDGGISKLQGEGGSKILNLGELVPLTEFQRLLKWCDEQEDCKCAYIVCLHVYTVESL